MTSKQQKPQKPASIATRRRTEPERTGTPSFPSALEPLMDPARFFSGNPFSAMLQMHEQMDRMLAQAFGVPVERAGAQAAAPWAPAIEVSRKNNHLVVAAELPGLRQEDVKVQAEEGSLIIEGERRQESQTKEGGMTRSERRYGHFYRSLPLPKDARLDEAAAKFKDGVLEVSIPLAEPPREPRRQIPVEPQG